MSETPTGPGWYDDPDDPSLLRYFDGVVWSSHTTPRSSPSAGASTIGRANDVPRASARTGWAAPGGGGPGGQQGPSRQAPGQQPWGQGGGPPPQGWGTAYGQSWQHQRKDVLPDGAVLAEWWRRLSARILDWVVVYLVTLVVAIPWLGDAAGALDDYWTAAVQAAESGGAQPDTGAFTDALVAVALPVTLISLALTVLYEVVFLTWRGATPGKMLFGMVVRRTGGPGRLSVVDALRRQVLTVVSNLVALVPLVGLLGSALSVIDPAWLLWDPRRQALHDKVADTVVVLKR